MGINSKEATGELNRTSFLNLINHEVILYGLLLWI
jgi:hypothetical protein